MFEKQWKMTKLNNGVYRKNREWACDLSANFITIFMGEIYIPTLGRSKIYFWSSSKCLENLRCGLRPIPYRCKSTNNGK